MKVYGHADAARFLGIHPQTLRHRVFREYIRAVKLENGEYVYDEEDLLECRALMTMDQSETTVRMVSKQYKVPYYRVLKAFRLRGVEPKRRIGRLAIYSSDSAHLVAKKEKWKS